MDKITSVMASWEAFLLAFAAFALLGVVRRVGTRKDDKGKVAGGWAQSRPFKMLLPIYPYVLTVGFIFIPGVPLPAALPKTLAAKLLFAIWSGWLSDKSFAIAKKVLEKGFNMKFGAEKE